MKNYFIPYPKGSHPIHQEFAKSVNAEFIKIPSWLPLKLIPIYSLPRILFSLRKYKNNANYLCEGFAGLYFCSVLKLIKPKIKIIYHDADPLFYYLNQKKFSKLAEKIIKYFLKNIDGIITVSELNKKYADRYIKKRIIVSNPPMTNEKKLFKINPARNTNSVFIYAARLDEDKNIERIIKIFNELNKIEQRLKLYVLGKGSLEQYIKNLTKKNKNIEFAGFAKDISIYLKKSDFLIHLPIFDPHPCINLEAMASGVIPIISNTTGTKYLMKDKRFVIDLKMNDKQIANHIIKLIKMDKTYLNELRLNNREIAKNYTMNKKVEEFRDTFEKLTESI